MTSTPPPEKQQQQQDSNNSTDPSSASLLPREDTSNEGYTGFDPSSGLYYYTNGVDQTMFYDGFNNQWLYWNNEGQYYYPVGSDASVNPADEHNNSNKQKQAVTDAETAKSTGVATLGNGISAAPLDSVAAVEVASKIINNDNNNKIPDEDKRPLPFRLTSGIQSERERLLGTSASGHAAKKRIDWGAALENFSVQGFGGRSGAGGGLGHFSNPPILPTRFYYPHIVAGTYYDFLNVRPNASVEEIEESVQWWELVGYPRAAEADLDRAERIHRLVMEAALVITNSSLRAQYDQTLPLGGKGKGSVGGRPSSSSTMSHGHGMLDVSSYVPRVLHFHQGEGNTNLSGAGSRSSSRPGSVTSTPSKYPGIAKQTPGGASTASTNDDGFSNSNQQALLEEDISQPSITERLFAAVSEGIFGPPRTKPRNKKYAAKGMEWIEDERRRMGSTSGSGMADEHEQEQSSETFNGEAAAPNSGFKVTNTTNNQSKHTDPSTSSSAGAVKPPL